MYVLKDFGRTKKLIRPFVINHLNSSLTKRLRTDIILTFFYDSYKKYENFFGFLIDKCELVLDFRINGAGGI